VQELYQGIIAELNRDLARFEQLKRVLVVAEEFSAENGTLTASMKLRRRVVEDRYRVPIEEMYAQAEAAGTASKNE
jgi:long-chain acyl-CoA synthetase